MKKYEEMAEKIEALFRRGLFTQQERDEAMDRLTDDLIAEFAEV